MIDYFCFAQTLLRLILFYFISFFRKIFTFWFSSLRFKEWLSLISKFGSEVSVKKLTTKKANSQMIIWALKKSVLCKETCWEKKQVHFDFLKIVKPQPIKNSDVEANVLLIINSWNCQVLIGSLTSDESNCLQSMDFLLTNRQVLLRRRSRPREKQITSIVNRYGLCWY